MYLITDDTGSETLKPLAALDLAAAQRTNVSALHTIHEGLKRDWPEPSFPVQDPIASQPRLNP